MKKREQELDTQVQSVNAPTEVQASPQQQETAVDRSEMAEQGRELKEQSENSPQAKEGAALKASAKAAAEKNAPKRKVNKTGIPDRLKAVVEHFSGLSLDEVRVHYNSDKPAKIGALAYAEYPNIYIGKGEEKHLAEEVWHIVQQMKGEAKANTTFEGGKKGNNEEGLEATAVEEGQKSERATVAPKQQEGPIENNLTPKPVAQRAAPDPHSETEVSYQEYKKRKQGSSDVTLKKISSQEYDKADADAKVTQETGYTVYDLASNEDPAKWDINDKVVSKTTDRTGGNHIAKSGSFKLPVSCIESAEHLVHYSHLGGDIDDWERDGIDKSVDLSFSKTRSGNQKTLNISQDTITKTKLRGAKDYDFSAGDLDVGDGLLIVKADKPAESVHAVAVVAKNSETGQFIVLERNAGMTSGDYDYVDSDWTLNIYDNPAAFKSSMPNSDQYIMGRLTAG